MSRALRHALGAKLLSLDPRLALDGREALLHALPTAATRHSKRLALRRTALNGLGALAATAAAADGLDRLPVVVVIAVTAARASRSRRGNRQRRDAGSEE